jgi:hypothetical protein
MSVDNEWQRLQQLYAGLSDDELLNLAASKDELTEVAQQAFAAEMGARGLALPVDENEALPEDGEFPGKAELLTPERDDLSEAEKDLSLVALTTFQIATDAEKALRELDEYGIPVVMEPALRRINEDGPRIKTNWLTVFVERTRHHEAKDVLRKSMGLFPILMTDERDDPEDEGVSEDELQQVGAFDVAADAEIAQKALTEGGIWFAARTEDLLSDDGSDWKATVLEVRPRDFDRALIVLETALSQAE